VGTGSRFVDNGDGTVKDNRTCLVWEKKTGSIELPVGCLSAATGTTCWDPHNVNNIYSWTASYVTANFDGTAATLFLAELNSSAFAGHTDWRLPTVAGTGSNPTGSAPELESILLEPFPCSTSPCVDPVFGITNATGFPYGSASQNLQEAEAGHPYYLWSIQFKNGFPYSYIGESRIFMRAVRGGPGVP
jgi:hypothetical protein